uniref:Uncharacterized protein n=1 Tax=Acrobeloides nanus TaxID=290746 RepID=A0A914DMT6_9BILA
MKTIGAVLFFFLINHQNSVQESINVTSSNLKIIDGTIQVDPYPENISEVAMFMDLYDSENNSQSIDTFYKIPEGFPRLGFSI